VWAQLIIYVGNDPTEDRKVMRPVSPQLPFRSVFWPRPVGESTRPEENRVKQPRMDLCCGAVRLSVQSIELPCYLADAGVHRVDTEETEPIGRQLV
jgi:hypothetical protein